MGTIARRDFLAAAGAALCWPTLSAADPGTVPPKILFVCQYGSVKSAIARELLKRRAAERRVPVVAASRGITPDNEHRPEHLTRQLLRDGIDAEAQPLRKLGQADLDGADRVILFNKLPEGLTAKLVEDWTDLPSMVEDYPGTRAHLDRRIDDLVTRLAR